MCSEVWSDAIFRTSEKQMSFLAHDYGSLSKRVHYVSGGAIYPSFLTWNAETRRVGSGVGVKVSE